MNQVVTTGTRRMLPLAPLVLLVLTSLAVQVPSGAVRAQEPVPAAEAEQPPEAPADPELVDTITVTAQKRPEALEEIPMSVTVLAGEQLEQQRVEDFQDLVNVVPGLSVTSTTPGVTRITLRGINTGGVATTVGVYVDDVPYGSSSGLANAAILSGDFDTFDLERVEVLRGPQGTLYGASSLGGVLKYVPSRPTTDQLSGRFQGSMETVEKGDLGYSITGALNLPASDRFAVRATGFYRFDDGFIDSIGDNPIPSLTDPANNIFDGTIVDDGINSLDKYGARVSGLFEPSDSFSMYLAVHGQNIESGAPAIVDADPITLEPLNSQPVQSRYLPQTSDIEYRIGSATLDWTFDAVSLQSITSFSTFDQDLQTDASIATTLTGGPPLSSLVTFLFGDPATSPLSVAFPSAVTTDKITQELRLVSTSSESLEWLIGAYYTDEDSRIAQQLLAVDARSGDVVSSIDALADISLDSTYEELALFANATWRITPRFDLSFGGRASDNEQVASQVSDGALVGGLTRFDDADSSESPVTYSLSPRFELGDRSSIYARVATGFRPGGPNVLPPGAPADTPATYDSDELTSYEAGFKTVSAGGRATLDVAAYHLDWDDIQLLAVVNNFGINANGGTAVSEGVEFALALRPTDGLLLSFNGAYTDAHLTQDTDPVVGGLDGDPLSWVPEWSFGLQGDYAWPLRDSLVAHVGGSVGYTGDRPADFGDRDAAGNLRDFDSMVTVGVNAGVDFGAWSLEVYGRNLTDEEGVTSVDAGGFLPSGALALGVIRPRSIGVGVATRF